LAWALIIGGSAVLRDVLHKIYIIYYPQSDKQIEFLNTADRPIRNIILLLSIILISLIAIFMFIWDVIFALGWFMIIGPLFQYAIIRVAHGLAAIVILILCLFTIIFWKKNQAKHRKLIRIHRSLKSYIAVMGSAERSPKTLSKSKKLCDKVRKENSTEIDLLLDHMLTLTARNRYLEQLLFKRARRTAWILMPDAANRVFKTVHVFPNYQAYAKVRESHRPSMYNEEEYLKLKEEIKSLDRNTRRDREDEFRESFQKCISLTAWVFEQSDACFFPEINYPEFNDSYIRHLPKDKIATHSFHSAAGIPLMIGNKKVGVMMLFDPAYGAFLEADLETISIFANLIAPLVDCAYT
jgi:hypothetical protein